MEFIILAVLFSILVNIVMFVPAYIKQTDKLTDISYAVTFGVVALFGYLLSSKDALHIILFLAVVAWALRLGGFLFMRINYTGKDSRFDGMRENFWRFLRFWFLQGLTVGVVMLGILAAFSIESVSTTIWTYVGMTVFATGLLLEATADRQKFNFSKNPNNKSKWIDQGVWRMSRHPNYLGEMMVWTGLFVALAFSLDDWGQVLLASLSPIYIIGLLLFASGVPLLEKSADKKWGKEKSYLKYKKETPVLIPTIGSIKRAINKT